MRFPLSTCLLLPLYLSSLLADAENGTVKSVNLPEFEPVRLEAIARIQHDAITESSGIVRSRHHEGIYWTHNDSGDTARIFPLRLDGTSHNPKNPDRPYSGILFLDAGNVDWEDIAADDRGNLIIGAFGNNANARRDLAVYLSPEPVPFVGPGRSLILKKIPFHFPDQEAFPPENRNFDCEAIFYAYGKIYVLSKHRSDTHTKLYRFDSTESDRSNPLTLLDRFDINGLVSGADATQDGTRLAVLTYKRVPDHDEWLGAIWVFHQSDQSDNYFDGEIYWLPAWTRGGEAICWESEESLIVTNEGRDIFRINTADLIKVR